MGSTGRRRTAASALAAGCVLAAAACGGSGGGGGNVSATTSSSAKPTASAKSPSAPIGAPLTAAQADAAAVQELGPVKYATGDTTRGVNGKVITIGGVATVKDSSGVEDYPGVCDAAKARFMRANREGGVNGYTFNYVGCSDDGGNADTTRQKLTDLVQTKKAFAVVPYTSAGTGVGDFLDTQHVPYFGWGITPGYCGWNDRQFGFGVTAGLNCLDIIPDKSFFSSVTLSTYLAGTHKDPKNVKLALLGSDDSVSVTSLTGLARIATNLGMTVAYNQHSLPAIGAAPLSDYTPLAQAIVSSGATVITILAGPGPVFGLDSALRAAGYTGDVIIGFADARLLAVVSQIDKAYANTANVGSESFPSPAFTQLTADLKAVGSTARADSLGSATSYAAADFFIEALKKVQGPLTTESLAKTINSGFTYAGVGNVICGTTWPGSRVVTSTCGALVQFDATKKAIVPIADLKETGSVYLYNDK